MGRDYSFLTNLGFSLNEAKVYVSLIECGTMNGYEIAKASGVSRSLVYGVIERLAAKGYIQPIKGDSSFYEALPYTALISRLKGEGEERLRRANDTFSQLCRKSTGKDFAYNFVGYERFLEKAKELIADAKREISLSAWTEELDLLSDYIAAAKNRGVKIYVFSFGPISLPEATVFAYGIKDADSLFPYRRNSIVVDGEAAIISEYRGADTISIFSRNHVFVSVITDEIVLNTICFHFLKARGALEKIHDVSSFLRVHEQMRQELNISNNIAKNLMVYEHQAAKKRYIDE